MESFSKVKDADGKMVGPVFKTMKSEYMIRMMKISMTTPKEPSHIEI